MAGIEMAGIEKMRNKGFTLIELMIAIAILAILAAIAIPIYTTYSNRTYRTEAMADLMDCAQAMERRASVTFDYLGAAAGGGNVGTIDAAVCTPESMSAVPPRYRIDVTGTAADFRLDAFPLNGTDQGRQIFLDSAGRRGWDQSEPADGDFADADEMNWEEE